MSGEPIHDITTDDDRRRAVASEPAITVGPDIKSVVQRELEKLVSPSGALVGKPRPLPIPPTMHVDPRLPARSWHHGPPRP